MTRKLHPEEEALWSAATRDVKSKRGISAKKEQPEAQEHGASGAPPPVAVQKTAVKTSTKAPLAPLHPQLWREAMRQFKASTKTQATLDLHGMTQDEAYDALEIFLTRNIKRGARHIEIITGKGLHGEGILRRQVPRWLNEAPWRAAISALAYAPENKGGEGVLHVLLKAPHRSQDAHAR